MSKRIWISIFCCLAVVLCVPVVSNATEDSQTAFLDDLKAGLEARWAFSEDESAMTVQEYMDYRAQLVDAEYSLISEYKDVEFEDETFDELAHAYIEALELQSSAIKYYESNEIIYNVQWTAGYNTRALVLCNLVDNYGLEIPEDNLSEFRYAVVVLEFTYASTYTVTAETEEETEEEEDDSPAIEIVSSEVTVESDEWWLVDCVIKNVSDTTLEYVYLNAVILDDENTIITTAYTSLDAKFSSEQSAHVQFYLSADYTGYLEIQSYGFTDEEDNWGEGDFEPSYLIELN